MERVFGNLPGSLRSVLLFGRVLFFITLDKESNADNLTSCWVISTETSMKFNGKLYHLKHGQEISVSNTSPSESHTILITLTHSDRYSDSVLNGPECSAVTRHRAFWAAEQSSLLPLGLLFQCYYSLRLHADNPQMMQSVCTSSLGSASRYSGNCRKSQK